MANLAADPVARLNKINHLGWNDGHLLVVVTLSDLRALAPASFKIGATMPWPEVASPSKTAKRGLLRGLRTDAGRLSDIFRIVRQHRVAAQIASSARRGRTVRSSYRWSSVAPLVKGCCQQPDASHRRFEARLRQAFVGADQQVLGPALAVMD